MKKLIAIFALTLSIAFLPSQAFADTLNLVSATGASVGGEIVFPYNFSINGSSTTTPLICIDFNRHITVGESWSATKSSIPTDSSLDSTNLRALTIIASSLFTNNTAFSAADYQYAAWSVLDLADVQNNPGYTSAAQSIRATALAEAANTSFSFAYGNFYLYTPDAGGSATWTDGVPQRFIGFAPSPVPEPSSLLLLGTGILGLSGAVRRKLSPSK